jgi:broad specificity phosphatase PhoE
MPAIIHFVRHGAVDDNGIYYGRLPGFHLSPVGRDQADEAARVLGGYPIAAIYSSPMERTAETAEIIGKHLGMGWQTSHLLNEAYTPFDGQPKKVLAERDWDVYTGSEFPFEQPADVLRRTLEFTLAVRKEHQGQHIVAVTHGDVIAFMVLWGRQLPATSQQKQTLYKSFLTYASVSSLAFETMLPAERPREFIKP